MLRCFLKTSISRENFLFSIKNTKRHPRQEVSGGEIPNLILKKMLELFLKIPPLMKILEFQDQKKAMTIVQKESFEPKIKQ